jgi:hypothetical protein
MWRIKESNFGRLICGRILHLNAFEDSTSFRNSHGRNVFAIRSFRRRIGPAPRNPESPPSLAYVRSQGTGAPTMGGAASKRVAGLWRYLGWQLGDRNTEDRIARVWPILVGFLQHEFSSLKCFENLRLCRTRVDVTFGSVNLKRTKGNLRAYLRSIFRRSSEIWYRRR